MRAATTPRRLSRGTTPSTYRFIFNAAPACSLGGGSRPTASSCIFDTQPGYCKVVVPQCVGRMGEILCELCRTPFDPQHKTLQVIAPRIQILTKGTNLSLSGSKTLGQGSVGGAGLLPISRSGVLARVTDDSSSAGRTPGGPQRPRVRAEGVGVLVVHR